MGTSAGFASYCESLTYSDIPPETLDNAKKVLLDTLGIAVGGARAASTTTVTNVIDDLDPATEPGSEASATILSNGNRASPDYAAMINGMLAHSLDYDETHREGSVHAAAPVLGAALPVGEIVGAAGRDLLSAFVAGYEVTARLGMALNSEAHYGVGFHATSTCGVFGATAAIGWLRGFDAEEFQTAFGVNGSQSSGSLQFLENGAWNKRLHPGLAAHSAWIATTFANHGFVAASDPIEGQRGFLQTYSPDPLPDRATAGLGGGFEIDRTGLKPYPLCRFVHPAVDGLLKMVETHDVAPEDVTSVRVGMSSAGYGIVGEPEDAYPQSIVDAQFSMPFAAMLAITRREATVDALFDAVEGAFTDEEKRLLDATTTESADWADAKYPEQWAVEVTIETNGESFETVVEDARGDPENPLSWNEVSTKFDELVVPVVGQDTADRFRERIEDIEAYAARDLLEPLRDASFSDPN
jgi:2-methylcitrate dehydratase PrpD